MTAYYNEIDPAAAQWLRNLIAAGHIAPGDVDERSIEDVTPDDLANYTQCHFFAGVGVWSYALRRAGWPDDLPIWTGSCPCQPFSSAGKGGGFADERHLWPHFHWLIKQRKPAAVLGEQVASKYVMPWIDLVQADVEALGYAFGCVPFPSAGVGAPHIRDRAYWVADAQHSEQWARRGPISQSSARDESRAKPGGCGAAGVLANTTDKRFIGRRASKESDGEISARKQLSRFHPASRLADARRGVDRSQGQAADHWQQEANGSADRVGGCGVSSGGLGHAERHGLRVRGGQTSDVSYKSGDGSIHPDAAHSPGPTNGFWRDADWLFCRDGKWRPVEPGTFPLVDGATARVVRLRAYGNAINAEAAHIFIESWLEARAVA